jgi:dihydroxyacetone kinase
VARRALAVLRAKGVVVERAWSGAFMTALEMPGCSLTLLKVDDARLARLDAPTGAPAWPGHGRIGARRTIPAAAVGVPAASVALGPMAPALRRAALAIALAFEREEAALTDLDSQAGDGDLGISMVRGASALRALPDAAWATPSVALSSMGDALRRAIAGSSGPFYATALLRAAREMAAGPSDGAAWARAFAAATAAIGALGGAKPGDRTMLDALQPAVDAFAAAVHAGVAPAEAWRQAVAAAEGGAAATATMRPRLGRAAYLGDRVLGVPDAGASAVLVWMKAIRDMPR